MGLLRKHNSIITEMVPPDPVTAIPPTQPISTPTVAPVIPARIVAPAPLTKDHTEPIRGIRKAMVKTMTAAQTIPPFGYYDEIDMTALVKFREHIKESTAARGVKFSYMPVFIKVNLVIKKERKKTTVIMTRL